MGDGGGRLRVPYRRPRVPQVLASEAALGVLGAVSLALACVALVGGTETGRAWSAVSVEKLGGTLRASGEFSLLRFDASVALGNKSIEVEDAAYLGPTCDAVEALSGATFCTRCEHAGLVAYSMLVASAVFLCVALLGLWARVYRNAGPRYSSPSVLALAAALSVASVATWAGACQSRLKDLGGDGSDDSASSTGVIACSMSAALAVLASLLGCVESLRVPLWDERPAARGELSCGAPACLGAVSAWCGAVCLDHHALEDDEEAGGAGGGDEEKASLREREDSGTGRRATGLAATADDEDEADEVMEVHEL